MAYGLDACGSADKIYDAALAAWQSQNEAAFIAATTECNDAPGSIVTTPEGDDLGEKRSPDANVLSTALTQLAAQHPGQGTLISDFMHGEDTWAKRVVGQGLSASAAVDLVNSDAGLAISVTTAFIRSERPVSDKVAFLSGLHASESDANTSPMPLAYRQIEGLGDPQRPALISGLAASKSPADMEILVEYALNAHQRNSPHRPNLQEVIVAVDQSSGKSAFYGALTKHLAEARSALGEWSGDFGLFDNIVAAGKADPGLSAGLVLAGVLQKDGERLEKVVNALREHGSLADLKAFEHEALRIRVFDRSTYDSYGVLNLENGAYHMSKIALAVDRLTGESNHAK